MVADLEWVSRLSAADRRLGDAYVMLSSGRQDAGLAHLWAARQEIRRVLSDWQFERARDVARRAAEAPVLEAYLEVDE